MRHKLIMTISIIAGGAVWVCAADVLRAADGSSGFSLMSAPSGPLLATGAVAVCGIPALLLALLAAVSRRASSVTLALCVLAIAGGETDGWLLRSSIPGDYVGLLAELPIWIAGLVLAVFVFERAAQPLRQLWPALIDRDDGDTPSGLDVSITQWAAPDVLAALICAIIGAVVASFLARTSDIGQIIGALMLGFGVGGFIAQKTFPHRNPMGLLISPMVVAAVVYGHTLSQFDTADQLIEAWYLTGGGSQADLPTLPGLALALPIHFVSAGVCGACMGSTIGRKLQSDKDDSDDARSGVLRAVQWVVGDPPRK